jgi:hypothetical protein
LSELKQAVTEVVAVVVEAEEVVAAAEQTSPTLAN